MARVRCSGLFYFLLLFFPALHIFSCNQGNRKGGVEGSWGGGGRGSASEEEVLFVGAFAFFWFGLVLCCVVLCCVVLCCVVLCCVVLCCVVLCCVVLCCVVLCCVVLCCVVLCCVVLCCVVLCCVVLCCVVLCGLYIFVESHQVVVGGCPGSGDHVGVEHSRKRWGRVCGGGRWAV